VAYGSPLRQFQLDAAIAPGGFLGIARIDRPELARACASKGFSERRSRLALVRHHRAPSGRLIRARGHEIGIIVDANGNYTVDEALASMRRIADYRIEWYEEPLPPLAFDGYAVLRPRAPIPIATGEALYTAWDFKRLLDLSAVDIVQPDLTMYGGLRAGREIALLLNFITSVYRLTCGEVESDWRRPAISSPRCPTIRTAATSCSRR
jgi:L-alanine-DL-glutamate epimerase-like enolase superfamily enzyme